jgi:hypothetical protein
VVLFVRFRRARTKARALLIKNVRAGATAQLDLDERSYRGLKAPVGWPQRIHKRQRRKQLALNASPVLIPDANGTAAKCTRSRIRLR